MSGTLERIARAREIAMKKKALKEAKMSAKDAADIALAQARLQVEQERIAVEARKEQQRIAAKSSDADKKLKAEVERDTSAWGLAELYEAQNVIDPRDTREYLIRTLEVHRMRLKKGVGEHLLRNWPTSY